MTNWFAKIEETSDTAQTERQKLLAKKAINTLTDLFLDNKVLPTMLFSGGKDSSTSKSLALVAWKRACESNPNLRKIPFIIAYADTRCESPIKAEYLSKEIDQAKGYAKANGIKLNVIKSQPSIQSSWAGKVIAGSIVNWDVRLGVSSGCAVDWKILNLKKALSPWEKAAKQSGLMLTKILGSRSDESENRKRNLAKIGATSSNIVEFNNDNLIHPIMDWTADNVWTYLMLSENVEGARFEGIKDGFDGTMRYYNDMNGGECSAVVSGDASCSGTRDGCWNCMVNDKPYLDEGIYTSHPHLKPLGELRRFMLENNIDARNRSWIPQTPSNLTHYKAACHSGSYLLDILKIGLTIQEREKERALHEAELVAKGLHIDADNAKTNAQFTIFTYQDIAWIDWNWSIRGLQVEPHAALRAYRDIVFNGERYDIPDGYKRKHGKIEVPENAGTVLYSGLEFDSEDDFDVASESISWQIMSNEELEPFFTNKDVIESWLKEPSFIKGADRWMDTKVLQPPKPQISRIKKKRIWAQHIYDSGMNKVAFHGGRIA